MVNVFFQVKSYNSTKPEKNPVFSPGGSPIDMTKRRNWFQFNSEILHSWKGDSKIGIINVEFGMPDGDCFLCDICSKTFSKAWGLKDHKKIHLGQRGKRCSFCLKTFPGQLDLEEHKLAEHSNGEYSEEFKAQAVEPGWLKWLKRDRGASSNSPKFSPPHSSSAASSKVIWTMNSR